ncbi:MAG: TonB-dependent receptor [Burkholderiaceae bacterium]|nr:TonB-dependent receptor [Burkholderiaceae bacterium]
MHRQPSPHPLSRALLAAGLLSQAVAALAQTQPAAEAKAETKAEPQTVVVTAQKRAQNIKEVPLAITVLGADQLEKEGLRDIADLAKATAGLEFGDQKAGGPGGSASIRGIGTAVFTTSAESSVGVVVDGVALGNTAGGALFDLERVEVLRGPQGTLFGKNASAGVINMVSKAPVLKRFEGFGTLELAGGETHNRSLRGAVNLPLGETAALRVTAHGDRLSGVYRNVFLNADSVTQGEGLRARLLYKPSADLVVNLIAEHDTTTSRNAVFFAPFVANTTSAMGHNALAEFAACGVTVNAENNQVCSDGPEYTRVRVQGLSGQIDWTLGNGLTLTSISAWRERETGPDTVTIDMSKGYDKVRNGPGVVRIRQITQELRLTSPSKAALEWTAGAFYSDSQGSKDDQTVILPSPYAPSPPVPRSILNVNVNDTEMRSWALFGQGSYKLDDKLSALAGLRYTKDRVADEQSQVTTVAFAGFALPNTTKTSQNQSTQTNLSGKLGLQYALDRGTNLYATLARGYKGPQIDNSTVIAALATSGSGLGNIVKPEISTSLELGLKLATADRKLDADIALFRSSVKDFQEQNCTLSAVGALSCIPLNVPDVTTYGAELDLRARPLPGLTLNLGAAAVLGTRYPAGFSFDGNDVGGQRLLYSPKGKLVLGAQYAMSVLGDHEWTIGADLTYKTRVRLCNTLDEHCGFKAHAIAGLRTALRSPDDKWGVALFVRNLGDERVPNAILYPLPGKGGGSGYAHSLGANSFRSVGMTADYRF